MSGYKHKIGDRIVVTRPTHHLQTGVVSSIPPNPMLDELAEDEPKLEMTRVYVVTLDSGEVRRFSAMEIERA